MKIKIIAFVLFFSAMSMMGQSIIVNDANDPQTNLNAEELIQQVLVSGSSCINITLTNLAENPDGTSNLSERSWGYFRDGGSNFPFEEGIILSSGFAVSAEGPNDLTGTSDTGTGWEGDIDIKTILDNQYGTNVDTNNATVFEFTFISSLNEINFEFIFASEEYEDQWECSDNFRDGFAFLIKGPGIPDVSGAPFGGTNIAAIEGSDNVPVSTATIHLDPADDPVNGFLCGGEVQGVNYFPEFYVSNDNDNINDLPIEFDGATVSLTTATLAIIPNEEYTIKMVLADRGDTAFDSAVFLKAGSFDIGNIDLGDDILIDSGNALCYGESIVLDAGIFPNALYKWFKDGVEIPNETSSTLEVFENGLYGVEITFSQSGCFITDEILVEFFPVPEFDLGEDQLICDEEIITLDATVSNPGDLQDISYKWFKDGVELVGEINSTLIITESGLYAVEVLGNGCLRSDDVNIVLISFTVNVGDDLALCDEESFEIEAVITGEDPTNATYLWNTGETTSSIVVSETGNYSVDVTIDECVESDDITIVFGTTPEIELGDDIKKCAQDIEIISALPSNMDAGEVIFRWYLDGGLLEDETAGTIEVIEEGIYSVDVENEGCIASDSITVEFYDNENCVITQGISPANLDNLNDNLDLEFLNDKSGITKIIIFNRHGVNVYEKDNYINEWHGQSSTGDILPVGVYYYVIELISESPITGWIYINK